MEAQQIHFHMQVIKRSEGRNAVACASYRHALAMHDERTGVKFDFSKSNKEHVGFSKVLAPVGTPPPLLESESLWQNVEFSEKRKDAQLCREFDAGLPMELTKQQQISLMLDFCQSSFVVEGMICDMEMHDKEDNPHFHSMITMRNIDPDAEYSFGNKNRQWNKKDLVDIWRHNYEECINKHLALAMEAERIKATHHYNKLIRGFDKKMNLRETWRAWKPVEEAHRPDWRQIGLSIAKTITGIIGSIRKLTTEYFDIYGRDVKKDAETIGDGGMSGDSTTNEPDDISEINSP